LSQDHQHPPVDNTTEITIPVRRAPTRRRADELLFILQSVDIPAWTRFDGESGLDPWVVEVPGARHAVEADRQLREHEAEEKQSRDPAPPLPQLGATAGAYWVIGLILINVLVFWAMEALGGSTTHKVLLRFGAIKSALLASGEWWRMVTAVFLHIGARHLLGNMALLSVLGSFGLRMWGPGRLLAIYIFAGLFGNIAGYIFGSAVALKAGASGAILGLLGALTGDRLRTRGGAHRFKAWHLLGMLIAFYGMVVGIRPQTDHIAHIGGIVGGALMALALPKAGRLSPTSEAWLQRGLALASFLLVGLGGLMALR